MVSSLTIVHSVWGRLSFQLSVCREELELVKNVSYDKEAQIQGSNKY